MRLHLSHCSGSIIFSFLLLSLQPGAVPKTSPLQQQNSASRRLRSWARKTNGFWAALPEISHFPTNLNNFYLRPISLIFHRSARSTIPVVARTCRFCGVKNDTNFQRILTIPVFLDMSPSNFLLSPMVLDTFSFCFIFFKIVKLRCHH